MGSGRGNPGGAQLRAQAAGSFSPSASPLVRRGPSLRGAEEPGVRETEGRYLLLMSYPSVSGGVDGAGIGAAVMPARTYSICLLTGRLD